MAHVISPFRSSVLFGSRELLSGGENVAEAKVVLVLT